MTPERDLHPLIGLAYAIPPDVYSADNTPGAVDLRGYAGAALAIQVGVGGISFSGTNKIEFVLTHSDDGVTYTAVDAADVLGVTVASGGKVLSLITAHAAADITKMSYIGGKRYVKLLADFSGTHGTGTPICAAWVLGRPERQPVA